MTLEPLSHENREQFVGRLSNSDYAISVAAQATMSEAEIASAAEHNLNVFWKDLHTYFGLTDSAHGWGIFFDHHAREILRVYGTPIDGLDYAVMISAYTHMFEAFREHRGV